MRADVTNLSRSPRGFQTPEGTRFLEPGETARLDLCDHPLHDAWAAAGEVAILAAAEPPPCADEKAGRRIGAARRSGGG